MSETFEERKKRAELLGTCKYHIKIYLKDGRCLKCDADYEKRKAAARAENVCFVHKMVKLDGPCHLCNNKEKTRRARLKANNKCPKHSTTSLNNGICEKCLERKEAAELANVCNNHPSTNLINGQCPVCDSQAATRRNQYRAEGVCTSHPKNIIGDGECDLCVTDYNNKRNVAVSNESCFNHPTQKAVSGMMCFDCWCGSIAGDALGSKKHRDMIKKSYLENPFCVFTGQAILPGHARESASLDHIIPTSQGGERKLSNCQWVQLVINVSKNDKTNVEYLAELKTIYECWGRPLTPINGIFHHMMEKNLAFVACSRCRTSKNREKSPNEIASYCLDHYFEVTSLKHFKTSKHKEDLKKLFLSQGGVCYYSRQKLVLGALNPEFKASIDHVVPTTRGGSQDFSNIKWVSRRMNTLKQNMLESELLTLAEISLKRFNLIP